MACRKLTARHTLIWRSKLPALEAGGFSRSRIAVIRVYDEAGEVIQTHEHTGDFKEW